MGHTNKLDLVMQSAHPCDVFHSSHPCVASTFLRTLGYHGIPVTVLGWQPHEFRRINNVFYFTDRVYTLLRYLISCRSALAANARVMFCDVDELYQVHDWAWLDMTGCDWTCRT